MRYAKIFLLNFQRTLMYRGLSFVWFLCALFDIGIIILFWNGAISGKGISGWSFPELFTYYLFVLAAGQFLMPHQEYDVAALHIQQGGLVSFLLKPFSYIQMLCIGEIPWRLLNGSFAVLAIILCTIFMPVKLQVAGSVTSLLLALGVSIFGFLIAFLYKMTIGLLAFWIIEIRGLFEALEMVTVILLGNLLPISLLPQWLAHVAYVTPFPYAIYFPVLAFEGKLSLVSLLHVMFSQVIWIGILFAIYQKLWLLGVKKFSAVGQ